MAELKPFEVIMRIDYDASKGPEVVVHAKKVQELVRCGECEHWMDIDNGRQKHEMCAQLMPNWFCADGEREVQE